MRISFLSGETRAVLAETVVRRRQAEINGAQELPFIGTFQLEISQLRHIGGGRDGTQFIYVLPRHVNSSIQAAWL